MLNEIRNSVDDSRPLAHGFGDPSCELLWVHTQWLSCSRQPPNRLNNGPVTTGTTSQRVETLTKQLLALPLQS